MAEGPIHQSNSVLEDTDHDSYTGSMGGDETMSESEYFNAVEHTDAEEKHETPASPSLSSAGPISGKDDPSKPKDSEEAALSAMTLTSGVQGSTVMVAHAAEIPSADNPDTQGPTGDSKSSVPPEDHKSDSERSILSRLQELEDHAQQVSVIIGIPSKRPPILEDGGAVPAEEKKSYSLAIKVKELNAKRFNSRSASDFYLIEILMNDRSKKEHYRERSRYFASSLTDTDETKILLQDLPSQIRIRSPYLLDLLEEASQGGLTYPDEGSSRNVGTSQMLFLYPFKVFVTYERQIREKLEKRLKEATDAIAEKEHTAKTTEEDLESVNAQASTSSHEKPDVNRSTPKKKSARGRQERHIIEIKALIQLFDQNLKGVFDLRHRFQEGKVSMILWDHLWLLYTIGGLVFQREPDAGHDPKLLRVAQFHGGRRIINEEQSHNAGGQAHESKKITAPKEKDTCFYISAFYIESDGASFFPVQEAIRIPHWDGLRHVRELRLFPFDFCQQGKDKDFDQPTKELWMQDLIDRGKRFAGLGSVAFKYFNGHSFGQDREQFDSPVVIDFVLAKHEVKLTKNLLLLRLLGVRTNVAPGLSHRLSLSLGNVREVTTRTKAIHDTNVDTIHNDIYFDFELAKTHVSKLGPSSAKFVNHEELQESHEEDYAIFNNFVWGFVLGEEVWAKLDLYYVREMDTSHRMMEALQLPEEHMNILKATVRPRAQTTVAGRLSLDLVEGKGKGAKIMLYGDPGVGKTYTAEALADYTKRPLYRITVGTLGKGVAVIEKNLKKIFKRGHKWGCIVLFDEADVFFLARDKGDPYRNQIVSIFLNKLEHYSGILILTTNRAEAFDEAILSRIPIVLYYPALDLAATLKLFEQHFKRLSEVGRVPRGSNYYGQSTISEDLEFEIDEKDIRKWVKAAFKKAKNGWWNGRQIQYGFQSAVTLAEAARRPYDKKIKLTVKEFEQTDKINSANQERQKLFGQPQRSMKDKLSLQATDNDDDEDDDEEAAASVKRE